jgi:hypothetical protein
MKDIEQKRQDLCSYFFNFLIVFPNFSFHNKEGWAFKAKDADDTDDNIRPWISGFVMTHGTAKAKELLKGSGLPRGYKTDDSKNWTIMFLDEILGMNETKGNDVRRNFDSFVRDFHFNRKQSLEGIV